MAGFEVITEGPTMSGWLPALSRFIWNARIVSAFVERGDPFPDQFHQFVEWNAPDVGVLGIEATIFTYSWLSVVSDVCREIRVADARIAH